MKFPILAILLPIVFCAAALEPVIAPWYPDKREVKPIEVITAAEIPNGPASCGNAAKVQRSLNGTWKCSGLETATQRFQDDGDLAQGWAKTDFDDAKWDDIRVPLDWYQKYKGSRKSFARGWYRTSFELKNEELSGRRVILQFGVIGYDATLWLNGKQVGSHRGDFTPFELDVTAAAQTGRNVLAVRVLTDQGYEKGRVQNVTHGYGSQWSHGCIKGGIWQDVNLSLEPEIRIVQQLVTPRLSESAIEVDYTIWNHSGKRIETQLAASVSSALKKEPQVIVGQLARHPVSLEPGVNRGSFRVPLNSPVKWDIAKPYLYFLTLKITDGNELLSCDAVRFGYREFTAADGRFYLNGQPIYLFGQNIEAHKWGGNGLSAAQDKASVSQLMQYFLSQGYNIVRTAHQPVIPEGLEAADELGLMIYNEWAWCFTTGSVNIPEFEKNNLREVTEFVETSHNHPGVVMWSLGNELKYRELPEIARQMDLQVATVRKHDRQGRPVSTFSGAGYGYGDTALDTDVLDDHNYVGLSRSWTTAVEGFKTRDEFRKKTYGDKHGKPVIIWESIGFSWSVYVDKDFKVGDAREYARYMRKPYGWGQPNGRGHIGIAPLRKLVQPRSNDYMQNLMSRRVFELYRLDPGHAGFAPWIGRASGAMHWTQLVYPSLTDDTALFPHNLFSEEKASWNFNVINDGNIGFEQLVCELTLVDVKGKETQLAPLKVGKLAAHSRHRRSVELQLPKMAVGNYQLRLALKENSREAGRNFYDLYIGDREVLTRKIEAVRPVYVLDTGVPENLKALGEILNNFQIPFKTVSSAASIPGNGALLVVPPEVRPQTLQLQNDAALTTFLRDRAGVLLVLEQRNLQSEFPGNFKLFESGNNFVDQVIPAHPVFAGLSDTEFDTWRNPDYGNVVTISFTPYSINAVAVKGVHPHPRNIDKFSNVLVDAWEGKGRVILSQFELWKCRELDSAAARTLYNLFQYAAGSKRLWMDALPFADPDENNYMVADGAMEPVNLAPYANIPFQDEIEKDGKGGWTDQGSNDFRMMPLGKQMASGIPFDIIDPDKNDGKNVIGLWGTLAPHYPKEVKGIRIPERKYGRLFFMHTAAWITSSRPVAVYRIHYANGKSADFEVKTEYNLGDWYRVFELPAAKVGIVRKGALGYPVCTFVTEWVNPDPDTPIVAIDLLVGAVGNQQEWVVSIDKSAPIPVVVAISGDRVSDSRTNLLGDRFRRIYPKGEFTPTVKVEALPEGGKLLKTQFSAGGGKGYAAVQVCFKLDDMGSDYNYLTCKIRSEQDGTLQFVLPERDWKGSFTGDIQVKGDNEWRSYRLTIGKDFAKVGAGTLEKIRPELFIFHRSTRDPEMDRQAMNFEIKEIILE